MNSTQTQPTYIIRPMQSGEIDAVANFIARGYLEDTYFHWVVNKPEDRIPTVSEYYKIYLGYNRAIVNVSVLQSGEKAGEIVGASIWMPHNTDPTLYDNIDSVVGAYAPNFRAVADWSHSNEPKGMPFYQLVAIVASPIMRGTGIGTTLLGYQIEKFDTQNIATYLEASTAFHGGGLYGKFGYSPFGNIKKFAENAILYPLFRNAKSYD